MSIKKSIMHLGCVLTLLVGTLTQAADFNVACSFESCSAQVTASVLQVTCSEKVIYNGAYELSTDFQKTIIQAEDAETPLITVDGMPSVGAKLTSTLTVSGKSAPGICILKSVSLF